VVQPRHHNNLNLLTRWTRMLAAPSGDWSVFPQIFADHWEAFQHAHPRYQTPVRDHGGATRDRRRSWCLASLAL
jgi:hypothetical protein